MGGRDRGRDKIGGRETATDREGRERRGQTERRREKESETERHRGEALRLKTLIFFKMIFVWGREGGRWGWGENRR